MKNKMWEAIYEIFKKLEKVMNVEYQVVSVHKKKKGSMKVMKKGLETKETITVRSEIRNKLKFLNANLREYLTEREVYLVLFPIVVYFDEQIQTKLFKDAYTKWPSLQKELFEIEDGGEKFYEIIDDILRKPQTIQFIYEIFYFCLQDGFQGKYAENPLKINEYKEKLKVKISLPKIDIQKKIGKISQPANYEKFPKWYYLGTCFGVIFLYGILYLIATV